MKEAAISCIKGRVSLVLSTFNYFDSSELEGRDLDGRGIFPDKVYSFLYDIIPICHPLVDCFILC